MPLPAFHDDGVLNLGPADGRWQRLFGLSPVGAPGREDADAPWIVTIGLPLRIHTGLRDWWTTTSVTSVRELANDGVPQQPPRTLDDWDDG